MGERPTADTKRATDGDRPETDTKRATDEDRASGRDGEESAGGVRPSRRGLLAAAGTATAAGLGAGFGAGFTGIGAGVSQEQSVSGRVETVRGEPLDDVRVDALWISPDGSEEYGGGRRAIDTTTTDTAGEFTVSLAGFERPPAWGRGRVVVFARYREVVGDGPAVWFGTASALDEAFPDSGPLTIQLDNRLINSHDVGHARLSVWEEFTRRSDGGFDRAIATEIAGDIDFGKRDNLTREPGGPLPVFQPQGDRAEMNRPLAGSMSLQTSESVEVTYRSTADPAGETPILNPLWTGHEAVGFDTRLAMNTTVATDQFLSDDRFGPVPAQPALHTDDPGVANAFQPYEEPDDPDTLSFILRSYSTSVSVVSIALFVLSFVPGINIVAAGATLLVLGLVTSAGQQLLDDDPPEAPDWAGDMTVVGDGSLPVDRDVYDLTTSGFRAETYAAVQRVDVDFLDDRAHRFCSRATALFENSYDGSHRAALEESFVIDPRRVSPLDDPPRRPPDGEDPGGAATVGSPPLARVSVSDPTPELGGSIRFDAGDTRASNRKSIDEYRWTVDTPDGVPPKSGSGESVRVDATASGDYRAQLTVVDSEGLTATAERTATVVDPATEPRPPIAADVDGEDCVFPPTGEAFPATGEGAAAHFGYGCGDWKVYEVRPNETYRIETTVDGCADCVLFDGAYVVEEPDTGPGATGPEDPESFEDLNWTVEEEVDEPLGKSRADEVHTVLYEPLSEYIRIRDIEGNGGKGFYAEVFGPPPADDDGDGGDGGGDGSDGGGGGA